MQSGPFATKQSKGHKLQTGSRYPLCHVAYFTPDHIVLSPAPQFLQYIFWTFQQLTERKVRFNANSKFSNTYKAVVRYSICWWMPEEDALTTCLTQQLFYLILVFYPHQNDPENVKGLQPTCRNLSILFDGNFIAAPDPSPKCGSYA